MEGKCQERDEMESKRNSGWFGRRRKKQWGLKSKNKNVCFCINCRS